MDFNLDGKELLNMLLMNEFSKHDDPRLAKVLQVFQKHNIGALDAIAIFLELSAVFSQEEE